jgi:bacterioferritin (cytochrome b1)
MADDGEMMSPVVPALLKVLALEEDLWHWTHTEEHWFRHDGYCKLSDGFHKKHEDTRERRRPILDRVFQLGGMAPDTTPDPESALEELVERLNAIHAACSEAYDAADDEDDYATIKILTENQEDVEKCLEKLMSKLKLKSAIGEQLWLDRLA